MRFDNTYRKKTLVEKYLGKYIHVPDRIERRCFIGYNYEKDIVVVETPSGCLDVDDLAKNKELNISKTHFRLAKMYSFKEIINLNKI